MLAGVTVLVAVYLLIWTRYAVNGLIARNSFDVLPPGATAARSGADFRLLELREQAELEGGVDGPEPAAAGAVWIVAELEVVRHTPDEDFLCTTWLASSAGREWDAEWLVTGRDLPTGCGDADVELGKPYRFEQIYQVPRRDATQIVGVVINDIGTGGAPKPVLTVP